eukprot:31547-Pelagococcus_subviridis.AAC.6
MLPPREPPRDRARVARLRGVVHRPPARPPRGELHRASDPESAPRARSRDRVRAAAAQTELRLRLELPALLDRSAAVVVRERRERFQRRDRRVLAPEPRAEVLRFRGMPRRRRRVRRARRASSSSYRALPDLVLPGRARAQADASAARRATHRSRRRASRELVFDRDARESPTEDRGILSLPLLFAHTRGVGARRASHFHLASDKSRSRCLRSPFTDDTGCRVSSLGHDGASLEHARRRGVVSVAKSRASRALRVFLRGRVDRERDARRPARRFRRDVSRRRRRRGPPRRDATRGVAESTTTSHRARDPLAAGIHPILRSRRPSSSRARVSLPPSVDPFPLADPPRPLPLPSAAEANPRDQGLPPHRAPQGREEREDQEDGRKDEVQGSVQQVPVHARRVGRRQGGQAEAVPSPRAPGPGDLSDPFGRDDRGSRWTAE